MKDQSLVNELSGSNVILIANREIGVLFEGVRRELGDFTKYSNMEANQAVFELFNTLEQYSARYVLLIDPSESAHLVFKQQCAQLLKKARPLLQKDMELFQSVESFFKRVVNAIVAALTAFFTDQYQQGVFRSHLMKETDKLIDDLQKLLRVDQREEQPQSIISDTPIDLPDNFEEWKFQRFNRSSFANSFSISFFSPQYRSDILLYWVEKNNPHQLVHLLQNSQFTEVQLATALFTAAFYGRKLMVYHLLNANAKPMEFYKNNVLQSFIPKLIFELVTQDDFDITNNLLCLEACFNTLSSEELAFQFRVPVRNDMNIFRYVNRKYEGSPDSTNLNKLLALLNQYKAYEHDVASSQELDGRVGDGRTLVDLSSLKAL